MRGRWQQLLQGLGLVMGLVCVLVGCGGSSGGGATSGTVARGRPLALQLQLSSDLTPQAGGVARTQGAVAGRQVQPGDPGFIERLEIRLQAQGSDLVPLQVFRLDTTEQETATRDLLVPDTAPGTFQVLVSAFTSQGIEAFRGDTSVGRSQPSAVVTLLRSALVPVPATPANLQQTTFTFTDGALFNLAHSPVTLATGMFVGQVGDFALQANGQVASGSVVIGSCTLLVATSTFPVGQGPQVGDKIVLDPCQIDAIDGRLIATNATVSVTATSSPPVPASSEATLNLTAPPTLTIQQGTSGSFQISASVSSSRPETLALAITISPAHGTATLTTTGVVTYTPEASFTGSDGLMVTAVVSFTDNRAPALLLGTIPLTITVTPVPGLAAPTLSAITPSSGPTSGGTVVTLTGSNFQTGATVTIGGQMATSVHLASATQLLAITPAGAAGPADVVVTNPDGQQTTLAAGFTYVVPLPAPTLSAITPSNGPTSGGTVVTLTGSNFQTGATVTIGGQMATSVHLASATQLLAITPAGAAGPADVVVTNPDTQQALLKGGFTYLAPGACLPTSSLGVLQQGTTITAYAPNGCWDCTNTGIQVVPLEGGGLPVSIATPNVVNSCASNSTMGQTVCTANTTDVYLISGSTLTTTLTSAGTVINPGFSGGTCTNCGVAMNAATNTAVIALGLRGSPSGSGLQLLNLSTKTFAAPIPATTQVSEDIAIDPIRGLILSPGEGGVYSLFQIQSDGTVLEFNNNLSANEFEFDSAAEDCTTGIALASIEFTNTIYITDLMQAKFTPGSPGTWTAPSTIFTMPEGEFSSGTSGISVAPGSSHLGIVTGEFGGNVFAVFQLPSTSGSGTPTIVDYAVTTMPDIPNFGTFSSGLDPHTLTAYISPNDGKAYGVMANSPPPSHLGVIDLACVLALPRLTGTHQVAGSANTCVRYVATRQPS